MNKHTKVGDTVRVCFGDGSISENTWKVIAVQTPYYSMIEITPHEGPPKVYCDSWVKVRPPKESNFTMGEFRRLAALEDS